MTDKRTPDELPTWLYELDPDAAAKRDEWRRLVAADRDRNAPLEARFLALGKQIVDKTIVTGPAGNPDGRVPRQGVSHSEIDDLVDQRRELSVAMRPNPARRRIEAELLELARTTAETADIRTATAAATRSAHARIVAAVAELRSALRDRERSHSEWVRAARVGGVVTVGGSSYTLQAFEQSEVHDYRSGALTDGLDEAKA